MKRNLGMVLVLSWIAILVVGGWPANVRPAFLDAPNHVAYTTLRYFGIASGQPLFQTDATVWKQYGFCFQLRELPAPPGGGLLFPPEGACRFDGFFPRLPPVNRATHRLLAQAWRKKANPGLSNSTLEGLGRAFCRELEDPPSGLEGVWNWYYRHYETAEVLRQNGAYFDFSCDTERLGEILWHPTDDEIVARWGEEPW